MKIDSPQIRAFKKEADAILQLRGNILWNKVVEDEHGCLIVSGSSIPLIYIGRWLSENPKEAKCFDIEKVRKSTEILEKLVDELKPETDITFRFKYTGR